MTRLEDAVRKVAHMRHERDAYKNKLVESRQKWAEENKELIQVVENFTSSVSGAENELREIILLTPDSEIKSTLGVGIRNVKRYEYSEEEALFWAVDHKNYALLKLDTKKFEQAAEALELPGFIVHTERQATIARDLSKVL